MKAQHFEKRTDIPVMIFHIIRYIERNLRKMQVSNESKIEVLEWKIEEFDGFREIILITGIFGEVRGETNDRRIENPPMLEDSI